MPMVFPLTNPGELLKDPGEDLPVRLQVDQPTRTRDRGVIGRRLHQLHIQKSAQCKGIGRPPGNRALRIESFEVPNQQQSKIATGRQPALSANVDETLTGQ